MRIEAETVKVTLSDRCLVLAQQLAKAIADIVDASAVIPEEDLPVELRHYERRRAA